MELELRINGVVESLDVAPGESLLALLRREGYCSVKQGCESGECGACTVLVDGVPRPSCVMLAAQAGGCTLTTVESLGSPELLHPLQEAFVAVGAVQCGFCTPGMLLSAYALLQRNPRPTESEVRDALSGNLCRCTGYVKPVQAVMRAAAALRGEAVTPVVYNVVKRVPGVAQESAGNGRTTPAEAGGVTRKMPALNLNAAPPPLPPRVEIPLQVIGKPVPGIDAVKLVTGKPAFAADAYPRGMLYGHILTSPHAHAAIRDIDVSEAKALPEVHAVLTYKDVPRIPYSSVERFQQEGPRDQYCLDYIMRYVGDYVAVIAAETPEAAEQAARLIRVEYDVLPAVLDPRQALAPGAPCLHPESESQGIYDATRNVAGRVHAEVGDVERGFAEADVIVEGEYVVPPLQQVPIETHCVMTRFDEDDYLVVNTSTQAPHHVRHTLAHLLNMPARRIRVHRAGPGGGFGVKQELVLEALCALLTVTTRRPVLLAHSRGDEFRSSRAHQQHILRVKTGVKRDGTIVANQMTLLTSTGAYSTHPFIGQDTGAASVLALYPCPHMRFVAEIAYTNQVPSGAFHGYGTPQEFFALECHMDEIAKQLNMDALALRRKNWIKTGDEFPLLKGPGRNIVESCGLPACLQIVEEKLEWEEKRNRKRSGIERIRRGVGVALALQGAPGAHTGMSGAMMKLNEDGSFDLFAGANDSGAGSTTLLAQIAAEALSVRAEDILVHASGTDSSPFEIGEQASATLYVSGGAVKKAAEQMRRQVLAVAGRMLNALPEALKINSGVITAPTGQKVSVAQVAAHALYVENRHIMTAASWRAQPAPIAFGAHGVEVEVDSETGRVRIVKAVVAVDAGRVINPLIEEAQIQGSAAQGLGAGLCEEMVYDQKGALLTTDLSTYHIYNALDMPDLQTYLVETSDPSDLFGAKAVAELPLSGMAPALANAVADALGVRIRQIPLTPERVLRMIHAHAQAAKK
ncbi:MAG TPA: molybdopterin cofactor-binding domain-containing protein [Ktedonobacteraceae bacterium]|nr:molybdopterin cofactor-binding domain-containing protein [Ktedonobacteraceae bacterium]